jgi:tryptophan synthase alpha chain
MNRIDSLFQNKPGQILSVFFTAGYPALHSTVEIIRALTKAGADMIEIGMPFSDPMADGPVIQKSSDVALKLGMNMNLLFDQLKDIRQETDIPLLLMGYLNPVLHYGMDKFCSACEKTGIDGVILPDLPPDVFLANSGKVVDSLVQGSLQDLFLKHNLHTVFLISPQTRPERIREIDRISNGFLYMVSSSSTTGVKSGSDPVQQAYFERIRDMKLKNPRLIGFGISNHASFANACEYAKGAIIGSAFVNMLGMAQNLDESVRKFVEGIRIGDQKIFTSSNQQIKNLL